MEHSPKKNGRKTKEGSFGVALKKAIGNEVETIDLDKEHDEKSKQNALARTISRQKELQDKVKNSGATFHANDPAIWSMIRESNIKSAKVKAEKKD